jgi:hypothetical protein
MRPGSIALTLAVLAATGCQPYRVRVDCRLTGENSLWSRLNGPAYVIHGPSPQLESSLEFEDFSAMLDRALRMQRPDLHRVAVGQTANLQMTMAYTVLYRGQAIETYPDYRPVYGFGPFGEGFFDTYVGTEVRTVDLGYQHLLTLSAWIADQGQPAGRKALWEARADLIADDSNLKQTMPAMLLATTSLYGQGTGSTIEMKYAKDDDRFAPLRGETVVVKASEHPHHRTTRPADR